MLRIRPVHPDDIFTVIKLAYDILPERYNPTIFTQFYESFPDGFLIAERDNQIIGFLIGIQTTVKTARILMIAVGHTYQKQGVGSALLIQFLQKINEFHVSDVELEVRTTNTSALEFYKKHGFCVTDLRPGFYQNGQDAFGMKKNL